MLCALSLALSMPRRRWRSLVFHTCSRSHTRNEPQFCARANWKPRLWLLGQYSVFQISAHFGALGTHGSPPHPPPCPVTCCFSQQQLAHSLSLPLPLSLLSPARRKQVRAGKATQITAKCEEGKRRNNNKKQLIQSSAKPTNSTASFLISFARFCNVFRHWRCQRRCFALFIPFFGCWTHITR